MTPTKTILLVDDVESLRILNATVLQRAGYDVVTAATAPEALQVAEAQPNPIHLLVTHVKLPKANAWDLSKRLQQLRPDMKVLYISGAGSEDADISQIQDHNANLLSKPFTPSGLIQRVRMLIG